MKHKSHLCNFVYMTSFEMELQNVEQSRLSIMTDSERGKVHINTRTWQHSYDLFRLFRYQSLNTHNLSASKNVTHKSARQTLYVRRCPTAIICPFGSHGCNFYQ